MEKIIEEQGELSWKDKREYPEAKSCTQCNTQFSITDTDWEFYKKVAPSFVWKKIHIPSPKLCQSCRQQRRLSWRNERSLYKRKCDATGEDIISIYSPDKAYTVYNQDFRWSDQWDAMDYYLDIDFEKSFLEQFHELVLKVPKRAVVKWTGSENCDYVNFVGASKSCYLIFDASNNEKCFYSNGMVDCTNCSDSSYIRKSEGCYESIDVMSSYDCSYIQNSINCSHSEYLYNCKNCSNCFGCINLDNQSYCIENVQYTKEEYEKKVAEMKQDWYDRDRFQKFIQDFPMKNLSIINSENISGNIINNSSNIKHSYEIYDSENIAYSTNIHRWARDCMDVDVWLNNSFMLYECGIINRNCTNILFCFDLWSGCHNLLYSSECKWSQNCFMCNGLIGKEYCILNKQYTKEEYEALVPKIIDKMKKDGEWGEFFPAHFSAFGYNETTANEYFPCTKTKAQEKWFNWSDYEVPFPKVEKIIPASKLPNNIQDIPDDILAWAIECEVTKKAFRIIGPELEFYRKHNISIPKRHPNQRHLDRLNLRSPRTLYQRNCDKCDIDIKSTYADEKKETVYCEECFNKEIY